MLPLATALSVRVMYISSEAGICVPGFWIGGPPVRCPPWLPVAPCGLPLPPMASHGVSYRILSYHILLHPIQHYPILSCILSYSIVSYRILSCPIVSCCILSYPIVSYRIVLYPTLSYPVLSYSILTCRTVSCRMISDPIVSYRILLYPVVSYRIVSYIILASIVLSLSTPDQRSMGCVSSSRCGNSSPLPRSVGSSRVTLPSASKRRRTSTRGSATGWPELSPVRVAILRWPFDLGMRGRCDADEAASGASSFRLEFAN